jgi:hypothetical protein
MTTLVASINNKGHPALRNNLPAQNPMKEPSTNVVLDAVAMLLVRRNEVVAVAAISSTKNDIVAVESTDQPTDSATDDDLQDRKGISQLIPNVVALPNPDKVDNYIPDTSDHQCMLIGDGAMSHLPHIDKWRYNLSLG